MTGDGHKKTPSGIHYFVSGTAAKAGGTIVFLHPAFGDHRAFDTQVAHFAPRYRCITVDLLGHGLSQGHKTRDRIHDTHRHIGEILDLENVDAAHLVGVSVGALLAQDFANHSPERVLSLCAVGGYDINSYDAAQQKTQQGQQAKFILQALFSRKAFSKSNAAISAYTAGAQQQFYQMNLLFKRRSFMYMAALGQIMNQGSGDYGFPLLILYGQHDNPLAHTLAKQWHGQRANSRLACIENAGHCANMDVPEEFNRILENFLLP